LALHDSLTGLPNRALVLDRAAQMLARAARQPDTVAGALFVDVDGFKRVNDKFGHAAGDHLLRAVGKRLQNAVRSQDTVGRFGGDEFIVLTEATIAETAKQLNLLADRLIEALRKPFELDNGRRIFALTASIGVASGRYENPDSLLRDADLALYAAKEAGKDRYALFDTSMRAGEQGRIELEADLDRALKLDQFFMLYQPIFDLSSHEVISVEALIRWRHPTRGVIDPSRFVPLAEETGLITPIGQWVFDQVCRQATEWASRGHRVGLTVNVSAFQLGQSGFVQDVRRTLEKSGVEPSSITLEITETTLMQYMPATCERLRELKAIGVRLAIDDFGTGYASLSSLQSMPVDIVKVDQSFIAALGGGPQSRDLLKGILDIARSLSLSVIAEGIEDYNQLSTLEQLGCQMAQGFLLGNPVPSEDIEILLASRQLGVHGTRGPTQVSSN
jgi:diguanylate cyclase (GGDEF)-like protein